MEFVEAHTTVATRDDALRLADAAVQARFAACVRVSAVESVYRWQGAVESGAERLLSCKTAAAVRDALMALLRERHPCDQAAIHAAAAAATDVDTARWIAGSVG